MTTDATFWILISLCAAYFIAVIIFWLTTNHDGTPPENPGTSWPDDQVMTHYGLSFLDWADLPDETRARYRNDYKQRNTP